MKQKQSSIPENCLDEAPNVTVPEGGPGTFARKRSCDLLNEQDTHTQQSGMERPLTCAEAAVLIRAHPRTVKRMAAKGQLPGHFRFGRWFFYATELDSWMRTELHSARHSCR
jgi:excisionase family DNA binding protein